MHNCFSKLMQSCSGSLSQRVSQLQPSRKFVCLPNQCIVWLLERISLKKHKVMLQVTYIWDVWFFFCCYIDLEAQKILVLHQKLTGKQSLLDSFESTTFQLYWWPKQNVTYSHLSTVFVNFLCKEIAAEVHAIRIFLTILQIEVNESSNTHMKMSF